MSDQYRSYVSLPDGRTAFVSTVESKGGSLPMGVIESPWVGETCAWEWDDEKRERGDRLIFGPDYHYGGLLDRHIEAIHAVRAGFPYIEDWQEAQEEAPEPTDDGVGGGEAGLSIREIIALALSGYPSDDSSDDVFGNDFPQRPFDLGLLKHGRDFTGEGYTELTDKGLKALRDAATRASTDEGQTGDTGEPETATDKPCPTCGGDKRFTTGTLSGDLRELAKLIRDQTEQDWIGVTESNSVNETFETAQAWRHNCRAYAEGVEKAAGYIEDDGLAEAGRSVIADRLAEQLANGVPPEEIEWPEAWANLAREIKKYGGGSRD